MGDAWVVHGWCMGGAWVVHRWCMPLPAASCSSISQVSATAGVPRFCPKWFILQFVSFICLLISLGAAVGSIAQIVLDTEDYTPFVTQY